MFSSLSHKVATLLSRFETTSSAQFNTCRVEGLEARQMLAVATWDGGATGNGANLLDPLNWAGDVLPAAADDVVIGATGTNPTLTLGGLFAAANLTSSRAIQVNTGGNLSVSGTATQGANLSLATGTLTGGVWNMGSNLVSLAGNANNLVSPIVNGTVELANGTTVSLGLGTRFTFLRNQLNTTSTVNPVANYVMLDAIVVNGGTINLYSLTTVPVSIGATGSITSSGIISLSNSNWVNNGTITGTADTVRLNGQFVNNGVISTSGNARVFNNGIELFHNAGTLNLAGTGVTEFQNPAWRNSGTINLASEIRIRANVTTADLNLAGIFSTGGRLYFEGVINNTNAVFHSTVQMGIVGMFGSGGTMQGGTMTFEVGHQYRFGGVFRDVAVTSEMTVVSGATITLTGTTTFPRMRVPAGVVVLNNYTLNSEIIFDNTAGLGYLQLVDGNTASIGPAGIVRLSAAATGTLLVSITTSDTRAVLGGLIEQLSPTRALIIDDWFVNTGEIRVTTGTCTLNLANTGQQFVNQGTITVQTGAIFNWNTPFWSNPGLMNVSGGTVNLGGTWRTSDFNFAGFTGTNATVTISGTLENSDSTYFINAITSSWQFINGTLSGGTVESVGGAEMVVLTTGRLTLLNTDVNANVRSSGRVTLSGNTRFDRISMRDSAGTSLAAGFMLRDEIVVTAASTFSRSISAEAAGASIGATGVVRFDSTASGPMSVTAGSTFLISHGTIVSDSAAEVLVQGTTFYNAGTIRSNTGARIKIQPTTFINPGQLIIDGGTIELGGTVQGADFNGGGVSRTGGNFTLSGVLNNAGNLLSMPGAGSLTLLQGAVINGGTIALAPGNSLIVATTGSQVDLNSVIVQNEIIADTGGIEFTGASRFAALRLRGVNPITFPSGYTLLDNVYAEGAVVGLRTVTFEYSPNRSSVIAPGVTIELSAGAGGDLTINGGLAFTAPTVNSGTIRAASASTRIRILLAVFSNTGLIEVDGGSISFESATWTSSGQITATNGTVTTAGIWSSTGAINLQNCTTTLGGTFSTVGLNLTSFSRSGGTLAISGIWDNAGQSVPLSSTLGPIVLSAARITGGDIVVSDGTTLSVVGSGSELNSVQIVGDVLVGNTGAILATGTTRFNTLYLRGTSSVTFGALFQLQDDVVADGAAVGLRTVFITSNSALTLSPTGSVALAPNSGGDLTIRSASTNSTLVNNGLISADGTTKILTINTTTFTNNGTMSLVSGRLAFTTGTMSTPGQLAVSGGTLALGGTFNTTGFDPANVTRTGGVVELGGGLSNAGRVFTLNSQTGSWNLNGTALSSGQIFLNDGVTLNAVAGTIQLAGSIIQGDLIASSGVTLSILQGTRFGTLHLRGAVNVDMQSTFVLADSIVADGIETGTRTIRMQGATVGAIGLTGSLRLGADSGGDLAYSPANNVGLNNAGLISNDSATRLLTLRVAPLNNFGTIQAVGGPIQITGTVTNISAGVLSGGTWRVANGGVLGGLAAISTNNATIILEGAGAGFTALTALHTNNGSLLLGGTSDVTFAPVGGGFTQSGILSLDAGSHLHITGTFIQTAAGQLTSRIAGVAANRIGSLTVSGGATLNGSLTVTLSTGYVPQKLDGFDVVLAAAVTGEFASVVLPPPLPVGKNFVLYTSGSVRFVVSTLADINSDGIVDFFDYLDFVQLFSTSDPLSDFNGDETIDFFDYLDFVAEFGLF